MPCFDDIQFDKMKKINQRLLAFLILWFQNDLAIANSMTLNEYVWTNRLLVMITHKKNTDLRKQVRSFFDNNLCEIRDRNLKLLSFQTGEPAVIRLQKTKRSQTGLWLLGYDGSIKDFSKDARLLKRLFQTIDRMPMRQDEMITRPACN